MTQRSQPVLDIGLQLCLNIGRHVDHLNRVGVLGVLLSELLQSREVSAQIIGARLNLLMPLEKATSS